MRGKKINQKDGFGKEYISKMDGNCVRMENRYSQKNTKDLSAKEKIGEETTEGIGIALNTLAREQMIKRLLNDILMDIQVCMLEGFNAKDYITRLKNEIDNIYKQLEGVNK